MREAPRASQVALPVQEAQETWVPPLPREGPLEEEWQPTPASLPGESHGQRSLAGYSPWGRRVRHGLATQPPPPRASRDIQARLYWGPGGYRREQKKQQFHLLAPRGGDGLLLIGG